MALRCIANSLAVCIHVRRYNLHFRCAYAGCPCNQCTLCVQTGVLFPISWRERDFARIIADITCGLIKHLFLALQSKIWKESKCRPCRQYQLLMDLLRMVKTSFRIEILIFCFSFATTAFNCCKVNQKLPTTSPLKTNRHYQHMQPRIKQKTKTHLMTSFGEYTHTLATRMKYKNYRVCVIQNSLRGCQVPHHFHVLMYFYKDYQCTKFFWNCTASLPSNLRLRLNVIKSFNFQNFYFIPKLHMP